MFRHGVYMTLSLENRLPSSELSRSFPPSCLCLRALCTKSSVNLITAAWRIRAKRWGDVLLDEANPNNATVRPPISVSTAVQGQQRCDFCLSRPWSGPANTNPQRKDQPKHDTVG